MKHFLYLIIILLCITFSAGTTAAQTTDGIPYQAVARDAAGHLIASQTISLRITLLQGSVSGTMVYQETHSPTTNPLGLFTVYVTQGTPTGTFNPLQWQVLSSLGVFMKVEIDASGGTTYIDMGTTQLLSVPFALYAKIAGETPGAVVFKGTWDADNNVPNLASSTGSKGFYYVVSNANTNPASNTELNGIDDWGTGDWAIFNGSVWQKVDNSETVSGAEDISYIPDSSISATNVQDAIEEMDSDFKDLLDSYIHETDDGITVYLAPGATHKRIGIGDTAPSCPLGVKAQSTDDDKMICFTSFDASQKWNINLNPTGGDVDGFSIDDMTTGVSYSRLFIDQVSQGNVGIGTVTPNHKLHVTGANDGGAISIMVENLETGHGGWTMSHIDDSVVTERAGAFAIMEKVGTELNERITILGSSKVGINETLPYATLHVSRPVLDPNSDLSLLEGTGILVLGPIGDENLAFDSHQIQARTGEYVGPSLSLVASPLSLQPLGGGLIIHSSSVTTDPLIITNDSRLGVGTITPLEKVDINGAIRIGTTVNSNDGTIRYTGSDFEGRKSGAWVSLTSGGAFTSAGTGMITYNPSNAKVGIGVAIPVSALDVADNSSVLSGDVVTSQFHSQGSNSAGTIGTRIGVQIINTGTWSSSLAAKDIGIYVSNVSGQGASNSNLAAVFNGNTVIGDVVSSSPTVGTNGHRVLAIQTGSAPLSPAGPPLTGTGGIQIYSVDIPGGSSTFHLMNGNGDIIKLYKATALPAPDNTAVSSSYGTDVQNLIINMRDRINQLEAKLQAFGLLP